MLKTDAPYLGRTTKKLYSLIEHARKGHFTVFWVHSNCFAELCSTMLVTQLPPIEGLKQIRKNSFNIDQGTLEIRSASDAGQVERYKAGRLNYHQAIDHHLYQLIYLNQK